MAGMKALNMSPEDEEDIDFYDPDEYFADGETQKKRSESQEVKGVPIMVTQVSDEASSSSSSLPLTSATTPPAQTASELAKAVEEDEDGCISVLVDGETHVVSREVASVLLDHAEGSLAELKNELKQMVLKEKHHKSLTSESDSGSTTSNPTVPPGAHHRHSSSISSISSTSISSSSSVLEALGFGVGTHLDQLPRTPSSTSSHSGDVPMELVVKNLDTGEQFPIDEVAQRVAQGLDPIQLQIYSRLTPQQQAQVREDEKWENKRKQRKESSHRRHSLTLSADGASPKPSTGSEQSFVNSPQEKKSKGVRGWIRRRRRVETMDSGGATPRISGDSADEKFMGEGIRVDLHSKSCRELNGLQMVQSIPSAHVGAIWTMVFSVSGKYLATAGQDTIVRVWHCGALAQAAAAINSFTDATDSSSNLTPSPSQANKYEFIRHSKPQRSYYGHKADILDISWSKNNFLCTSSMDKTVRLWHVSRESCLCYFQHYDFVTSVSFHPKDDKYFVTGSLDEKLRVWNIPEHKLMRDVDTRGLITSAKFTPDGKTIVSGSYDGKCTLYKTETLQYVTQIDVKSTRGKNARGKKVTGMDFTPDGKAILITTNDSRMRMYHMNNFSLLCKFKGLDNYHSQIQASYSHPSCKDKENEGYPHYVICGSEDARVYLWNCRDRHVPTSAFRHLSRNYGGNRFDRNDSFESFVAFSDAGAIATVATFSPLCTGYNGDEHPLYGQVIFAASSTGNINVFQVTRKPLDIY